MGYCISLISYILTHNLKYNKDTITKGFINYLLYSLSPYDPLQGCFIKWNFINKWPEVGGKGGPGLAGFVWTGLFGFGKYLFVSTPPALIFLVFSSFFQNSNLGKGFLPIVFISTVHIHYTYIHKKNLYLFQCLTFC